MRVHSGRRYWYQAIQTHTHYKICYSLRIPFSASAVKSENHFLGLRLCGKRLMSMRATAANLGCSANTIANRFRAD